MAHAIPGGALLLPMKRSRPEDPRPPLILPSPPPTPTDENAPTDSAAPVGGLALLGAVATLLTNV